MTPTTLDRAPLGAPLLLTATHPDANVARRLASLGLRRGVRVSLVQKLAGGGRILSVNGGRIAVDAGVLAHLMVEDVA
ncbi:FeoA family protein [Propioniciclava sinopodophylli]|uniref:FeoA family protein n=1 Tax=Propioniciclava sinopodophylli TaxID=1837344 RepID=UPI0019D5BF41|nr:FeoA family protein [Propioniciclava sinopodophylli]